MTSAPDDVPAGPNRRARVRAATLAEIKDLAWAQLADGGPAALSLRSIARDLGMTGSAIYRYYAGRDDLVQALMIDGLTSLAESLEAAEAQLSDKAVGAARWLTIARAYRGWALTHRTEYLLVFGHDHPNEVAPSEVLDVAYNRGVAVLFRVMASCIAHEQLDTESVDRTITPGLRAQLEAWRIDAGLDLPSTALAACMTAWSQLHGLLTLELFGGFPPHLRPLDELFDQQMRYLFYRQGAASEDSAG